MQPTDRNGEMQGAAVHLLLIIIIIRRRPLVRARRRLRRHRLMDIPARQVEHRPGRQLRREQPRAARLRVDGPPFLAELLSIRRQLDWVAVDIPLLFAVELDDEHVLVVAVPENNQ